MAGDQNNIRVILGLLSLFRIIKFPGILKLETITDPFKGLEETLSLQRLVMYLQLSLNLNLI
jgi:hypothetical protein